MADSMAQNSRTTTEAAQGVASVEAVASMAAITAMAMAAVIMTMAATAVSLASEATGVRPIATGRKCLTRWPSPPGFRQITMKSESAEVIPAGRASLRAADTYSFNRRSGEITDVKLYSSQGKDAKVRGAVYTVHMGSWGGTITRLLTFLSALIGCTLPLTGYYLWIRRLVRKK